MRITVAVSTWNRCAYLKKMLEEMEHLVIPEHVDWQLILVNNNSTDDTDDIIHSFQSRLPITRLFEPTPGKSRACNLAVRHATGEYIVWTDDDVRVFPDWLAEYCEAFRRWPEASFFGGPIYPLFVGEAPLWLKAGFSAVASAYAMLDRGEESFVLEGDPDDVAPYGANMAVRRDAHLKVAFDETIGPVPGKYVRGEDTKLIKFLLADGAIGRWVPRARVKHLVPKDRQTLSYLREYYQGYGRHLAQSAPNERSPTFLGRPGWLWREATALELRYRWHRLVSSPERWLEDLKQSSISRGRLMATGISEPAYD